jgi:hypothetical protein
VPDKYFNIITYTQTILSAIIVATVFIHFTYRQWIAWLIGLTFLLMLLSNLVSFLTFYMGISVTVNFDRTLCEFSNFGAVTLIYYQAWRGRFKRLFMDTFFFVVVCAVIGFWFTNREAMNSFLEGFTSIAIVGYCVFYVYRLIIEQSSIYIQHLPMFWFTMAFLLYHTGILLLISLDVNTLDELGSDTTAQRFFRDSLRIVEHVLVLVGLWYGMREVSNISPGRT